MSDRITCDIESNIKNLEPKLRGLAEDVTWTADRNDDSFHDALCDITEYESSWSSEDCKTVMAALNSYWEY